MTQQENNAYILGTDDAELKRLGLQHQVWASEAKRGWESANFTVGQTLLDLGCGPGYTTQDMAYIVGDRGKVIAVDKSEKYINLLTEVTNTHQLNIEFQNCDFDDMVLQNNSIDGVYNRWSLAWIDNVPSIISKLVNAMKIGAKIVSHEYFDWNTLQVSAPATNWKRGRDAALRSFLEGNGDINIGRHLPQLFTEAGLVVRSVRPMVKIARPSDFTWQWPESFFEIYMPKLAEAGLLTEQEAEDAVLEFKSLKNHPGATLMSPSMIEVIAEKVS